MKTVLITGASGGIGKSLAMAFAAKGYNLGLMARQIDKLEEIRTSLLDQHAGKSLKIEIASLDVDQTETIASTVHSLADKLGGVDIVVVNAGINKLTRIGGGQLQRDLHIIQTNIIGAIATVDAAAEYFLRQGHGHVVGISSLASLIPIPRQAAYCASKAAFSAYLESARIELRRNNINVTTILPGFVKTNIVPDIDRYPFIISADKAAGQILSLIERKKNRGIVPTFPWLLLKPFYRFMPASLWEKFG